MTRRLPVLVLLVSLVVGGLVIDRTVDDAPEPAAGPPVDADVFPIASAEGARSSTWFCAGGTANEEAFADHVLTMVNPTDSSMEVTVTAFAGEVAPPPPTPELDELDGDTGEDGGEEDDVEEGGEEASAGGSDPREPVTRVLEISPRSRRRLPMTAMVRAPVASALVEAGTGGLVVEHEVRSIHGHDAKPCATGAADEWHFAWGATERDARELLVLFNPFPGDAIVDGRFSTEDGVREPVRFDGLVVPARSTIALDLGDDVTRRAEVAASITARTGRIVADRIVRVDGSEDDRGLSVQLGVPRPQQTWVFPDGFVSEDISETYVVYNPGDEVAEVEIQAVMDDPDEHGVPEPVALSLAPGRHTTVDVGADGRVPAGVAHAGVVRSLNDVPVVAERVLFSRLDGRRGLAVTTGSPVEAEEWFFAAGETSQSRDEWLTVYNLHPQVLAELDVLAVTNGQVVPVSGLQDVVVEAGERLAIRVGERIQRDDLAIVVRSNEPVVVERGLYRVGDDALGASNAIGVPGPVGLRVPADPFDTEVDAEVDAGDDLDDLPTRDDEEVPRAPDDVELPEPDETIVIDDPDAEADTDTGDGGGGDEDGGGGDEDASSEEG